MGVLGLWQLLAPVGQPVTLESLENKILAVDISIWLNQAVKGYRDAQGGSVPNAHLLSLFSRLCKLLFYKIRPIIVFDGGFPELKKQTIISRQQRRAAVQQSSRDFGLKILTNYLASQQLNSSCKGPSSGPFSVRTKEKHREEIFKLPPLPESSQNALSDSFESGEDYERKFTNFSREDIRYLNQIDLESEDFEALPLDVKQEILSTLKESRKHASWEQYNELPRESDAFSSYQMRCLLKKRSLQRKLEEVQRDMRRVNSEAYVSRYSNDHVVGEANKIMSDDASYYVLLKKICSKEGSESSGDVKPDARVMADTKDAFIKDIDSRENASFEPEEKKEHCLQNEHFKLEDNKDHRLQNERVTSITDASSDQEDDVQFLEYETHVEVKREIPPLDVSDEEDVDNPPLWKEPSHPNTSQSAGNPVGQTTDKVNVHLKEEEGNALTATGGKILKNTDMSIDPCEVWNPPGPSVDKVHIDPCEVSNTPGPSADKMMNIDLPEFERKTEVQEAGASSGQKKLERSETPPNAWMGTDQEDEPPSEIPHTVTERNRETEVENLQASDEVGPDSRGPAWDPSIPEDEEARMDLGRDLSSETAALESERAKLDRQSKTVQDHMVEECKELLSLFGIPYVVSPLEAEAQCAFYDIVGLSHGTITDDSDVWLFGGHTVYKNFFTQQKFVECYKDKEIVSHFGLSREKLIHFALLTGSDYTEGIEGVGPVTAMEIISEFPGEDALHTFRDWWLESNRSKRPPENKVRAKLLRLVLAENFPDRKVFDAYLRPEVDSSREKFTWGRPDLDAIRDYAKERFGWNQSKVDGLLLPVLKKLNERDKQTHLDSFFTVSLKKETNLFPSKRIMSALKKITSPQKQGGEETKAAQKRKLATSATKRKKAVQKAASKKTSRKSVQSQGPNLSEESDDDS